MKNRLGIVILTIGFSGLVSQMLILRELLIVFSGNELSIGIILSNWLILEAFGCFFVGKEIERRKNRIEAFTCVAILFSLSLPVVVYLTRILKGIIGVSIGETVGLLPILYSSALLLLPASVLHGALFTFGCKIYSMFSTPRASSISKVYVYETVGTIVGGIVWTYLLIPYLNAFQTSVGLSMLNFLALFVLLVHYWRLGMLQKTITTILGLLFIVSCYLLFSGGVDKLHHLSIDAQWKDHNIVHYQNSIYGNLCVVESGEQYIFFSDGIPEIITPIPDIGFVEKFVHLPMLSHPEPKRVLILSGGAGGVISEILKHPQVERVEYVELDPLLLRLIRKFSTPLTENELADKRVMVKHTDGRLFLKTTENRYDLILVGVLDPSNLQTNRFFTKEFFSLAKERLSKDGILVMGLPGSLDYLNDELRNLNSCIFNTLKEVFAYTRVFPEEGTNLFLSSNSKGISLFDRMHFINRLRERGIEAEVLIPRHIERSLHPGWTDWFLRFLEGGTQKINQDFNPLGLFYSISHWNALFFPYMRGVFRWFERVNLWLFFIPLVFFTLIFLVIRYKVKRPFRIGIPLCITTTGFAGMLFDLALIFTFQALYGYVFHWIGLLVTTFMVGVAAGAMIVTSLLTRIKRDLTYFLRIELTIALFSGVLPLIFLSFHPYIDRPVVFIILQAVFLILSFLSGLLVGAQFPLANKIYLKDERGLSRTAGFLYASDLLGGWLGGIIGGVVLLPVLGLLGTCVVVALLKLSSFIVIGAQSRVRA